MGYEQPTYTAEEILASTEAHAAHWENEARYSPPDETSQNDRRMLADGFVRKRPSCLAGSGVVRAGTLPAKLMSGFNPARKGMLRAV
jgi:hypothetical protein